MAPTENPNTIIANWQRISELGQVQPGNRTASILSEPGTREGSSFLCDQPSHSTTLYRIIEDSSLSELVEVKVIIYISMSSSEYVEYRQVCSRLTE
jgi:hypothetical protein